MPTAPVDGPSPGDPGDEDVPQPILDSATRTALYIRDPANDLLVPLDALITERIDARNWGVDLIAAFNAYTDNAGTVVIDAALREFFSDPAVLASFQEKIEQAIKDALDSLVP